MEAREIYPTIKVFTPTTPARLTFVERDAINDRLVGALSTPGKQIVVYGHSGSGKTTLLLNKLRQLYEGEVITRCVTGMSFEQAVCDAFEQLAPIYIAEQKTGTKNASVASLSAEYASIRAQISSDRSNSTEVTERPLLPPQLTPQTLARLMGAAGRCWVLEDFHKIGPAEKTKLAQVMKVFMDVADGSQTYGS
jgi:energy-coupling factor transporter ATP-binding protein EcfA2